MFGRLAASTWRTTTQDTQVLCPGAGLHTYLSLSLSRTHTLVQALVQAKHKLQPNTIKGLVINTHYSQTLTIAKCICYTTMWPKASAVQYHFRGSHPRFHWKIHWEKQVGQSNITQCLTPPFQSLAFQFSVNSNCNCSTIPPLVFLNDFCYRLKRMKSTAELK